jgi:hypothetical protein
MLESDWLFTHLQLGMRAVTYESEMRSGALRWN